MAEEDKLTKKFLNALNEIEEILSSLNFQRHSFSKKGFAYFIGYRKDNNTRLEFLFGPSDWEIEMIIYTSKGKFAFRDLLNITMVKNWVEENRYQQMNERNLKDELLWFIELLNISLPIIE